MYGRGQRLLTQPAQSTAPGVGPGTYQVDDRRRSGGESWGGRRGERKREKEEREGEEKQ